MQKIQIVIVDDHPLFRAGLAVALRRERDFEVLAEAGDAKEAIALAKLMPIDLTIVDVLMPGVSGISLAVELLALPSRDVALEKSRVRRRSGGFPAQCHS